MTRTCFTCTFIGRNINNKFYCKRLNKELPKYSLTAEAENCNFYERPKPEVLK